VLELVDNLISNNFDETNNYIKFKDIIIDIFIKNIEYYRNSIITKSIELDNKIVDSSCYGMSMKFNFNDLLSRFEEVVIKANTYINNNEKKVGV
jgi:hypothetical protein